MPYSYTLTATIPATPREVYDAWLDSLAHSEMTGGEAVMSGEIGAEVSAWGNYITGRNLELIPGERIVQSWRTSEFGEEHEDSIVTLTLDPVAEGTLLTLEHVNVPDEQKGYEEGGWHENYFEPMIAYFTELKGEVEGVPAAASRSVPKRPPKSVSKSAPKPKAKPAPKTAAPKPAAPKKKAAAKAKSKSKTGRKGAAKAAPKRAAKSARRAKTAAPKKAAAKKRRAKARKGKSARGKRR